jgi:DNA-binding response OmpR family regulator
LRLPRVVDADDLAGARGVGRAPAGYAVDVAGDAADAYERLAVNAYDLLLLDINLPDADGFTVCRALRRGEVEVAGGPGLRMMMLTARAALRDRVRGLDEGADDYLVKPFALAELLARVRALLRRDTGATAAVVRVGDLTLDAARYAAARAGAPLRLTPKEFGVLEYLMTRPGHVVSAEQLLEHVWDENADPFTETVRVTVGTLRRKLGSRPDGGPLIETVVGRGYRLREEH